MVQGSWFMVHGSGLMIMTQDERWNIYGSWFMMNGSRIVVHDSRFMVKDEGLILVHGEWFMITSNQYDIREEGI